MSPLINYNLKRDVKRRNTLGCLNQYKAPNSNSAPNPPPPNRGKSPYPPHPPTTQKNLIALRSRAIVLWFFLHLDTRANISFLSFVNCVFIQGKIIFYFPEIYFMHWIWCLGTLRYEVCNYLFVSWTKIANAFYIFPERLELIGVTWPTDWRVTLKFHNGLK